MPNGDALRVCRPITRKKPTNRHWCVPNPTADVRLALADEPCRLMPEIGIGAIALYRCEYLRLDRSIQKTETCWLWTGHVNALGYGIFGWDDQRLSAHRFVYTLFRGPIPYGLALDHLCAVKNCVNPDHLQAVTQGENVRRYHGAKIRSA